MEKFKRVLEELKEECFLETIDFHFANFLIEKFGGKEKERLLFAIISNSSQKGHTCFYIDLINKFEFYEKYKDIFDELKEGIFSKAIGKHGDLLPIIYNEKKRAYFLQKYYFYEQKVISEINKKTKKITDINKEKLSNLIDRYFPSDSEIDYQKLSALVASTSYFTLITGGPGTGKTTTVAKILLILNELRQSELKIKIAAPTGKAAARLQDSISIFKSANLQSDYLNSIPDEVTTIHRMLGYIYGKVSFKHNSNNKLDADVIVIDEASMIDISLMSKLLEAIKEETVLILLGDKNQLSSVAPGSILSDLCANDELNMFSELYYSFINEVSDFKTLKTFKNKNDLLDSIVELKKNYRYKKTSLIGKIAPLINQGMANESLELFKDKSDETLQFFHLSEFEKNIKNFVLEYYVNYLNQKNIKDMFEKFNMFKLLTPLKKTKFGATSLNKFIEQILIKEDKITDETFYHGKPIMITENDYRLNLFNGDIGLIYLDDNELKVYFQNADGSFRTFIPAILPSFETVYAMTVHKSQGSEFDNIALVLPDEMNPVLTRELIYTAVTRAKEKVFLFAKDEIYLESIKNKVWRMSGLDFNSF